MTNSQNEEKNQIISKVNRLVVALMVIVVITLVLLGGLFYQQRVLLGNLDQKYLNSYTNSIQIILQTQNLNEEIKHYQEHVQELDLIHIKNLTKVLDKQLLIYYSGLENSQMLMFLKNDLLVWEMIKRKIYRLSSKTEKSDFNNVSKELLVFTKNMNNLIKFSEYEVKNTIDKIEIRNLIGVIYILVEALALLVFLVLIRINIFSNIKNMFKKIEMKNIKLISETKINAMGGITETVTSEINYPLSVISAKASKTLKSLKKGDFDNDEITLTLEKILESSDKIKKIITDVKRIYSPKTKNNENSECKVSEVVGHIISFIEEGLHTSGIDIKKSFSPGLENLRIICDEVQLSQAFLNIISNAKFQILELEEKWIRILVTHDKQYVYFEIINSGPAISNEIAKKVFNPYFTTKKVGEGSGLGLCVTKDIVEKYNGKIYVKDNASHTTFVMAFSLINEEININPEEDVA